MREHAATVTRLFLERNGDALSESSAGLADFLSTWVEGGAAPARPLDPVFGEAHWALRRRDDAGRAAAGLGLYLASAGVAGAWRATFPAPVLLRFGPFLLGPARSLEVEATAERASIAAEADDGERRGVELRRSGDTWESDRPEGDGVERLPELSVDGWRITILPRRATVLGVPERVLAEAVDDIEPAMLDTMRAAFDVLGEYVPEYVPWVGRVFTHALLLNPKSGYVESGSMDHYYGFAHFSAYANPAALAELLVHESSHQYFNLLCLLGPFDDGTDTTLYYSTAKNRPRPLDRIGVAYHAFANVLIFYRECVAQGIDDDGWCERHLERWTRDLGVLEEPLRSNPALTDIGRALCEPLIERLQLTRAVSG